MARPSTIDIDPLLDRLSGVFREKGYEGAALTALATASGLKKASLYHRFPGGKEQMAREVLNRAERWLVTEIVDQLKADGSPRERLAPVLRAFDAFYGGGKQACLLNMLSSPQMQRGPFGEEISRSFAVLIQAFADLATDAGVNRIDARSRAERAVTLLHGSLVLSRGLGTTRPFRDMLRTFPDDLLGSSR